MKRVQWKHDRIDIKKVSFELKFKETGSPLVPIALTPRALAAPQTNGLLADTS